LGLKEILIEAFEQGRLLVAISFVCKVLEQSSRSKIFKSPNPWLMAQLRLLVELYHFADLRTGLKFEIEILLKALKLELRDIDASSLLKDRQRGVAPPLVPSQPAGSSAKPQVTEVSYNQQAQNVPAEGPGLLAQQAPGQLKPNDTGTGSLSGVVHHITSVTGSPLFAMQPALKRFIGMSIDRAIRDLFQAVVERSAKIACITTREMILKDFAMEPDEQKMRNAANIMVQNLASHLALVACKDPLRLTIGNYLRTFLQGHSSDHAIIEQAVQAVCDEANVSALCTFFENASSEKAKREIDEELSPAYITRKKHRERTGQPYYDMSFFTSSRFASSLPETLKQKPGGLQGHQLRVYEDFAHVYRPSSTAAPPQAEPAGHLTTQLCMEKMGMIFAEFEKGVAQQPALRPDFSFFLTQVAAVVTQAINREEAVLAVTKSVLTVLFRTESAARVEFCILVAEKFFFLFFSSLLSSCSS